MNRLLITWGPPAANGLRAWVHRRRPTPYLLLTLEWGYSACVRAFERRATDEEPHGVRDTVA
jgi:hypothetical protein